MTEITVVLITHVVALSLYRQKECAVECVDVLVECSEPSKADMQYFTACCENHAPVPFKKCRTVQKLWA